MAFAMGQKIILEINDVHVNIGEIVVGVQNVYLHILVKCLLELWGLINDLNQLVTDYAHIGDCIGDSVGSPIPWAIYNSMICSNDVFETSIDSLGVRTKFECEDEEMTDP